MSAIHSLITEHLDIWTTADTGPKSGRGRSSANAAKVYGISKLRELILELAVRGKLVPQDAGEEPAEKLLIRIQEERAKLVRGGDKKAASLPINEREFDFEAPSGWAWVNFGAIAQHNSGKTLDKGRNTGELRDYITTSNLYWGYFELTNVRQMPITDDELERCSARKGDLLICEGGEAGRAAVWPYERDICFQNHIHRARFFGEINPYYVCRYFEKLDATGEINQYRKGVGISNMSAKALASISVPLPPVEEQHRIVAKVNELMALCDQLESEHNNASEAHEKLVSHLLATLTQSKNAEDFSANWQRIATHFDTLFTTEASIDALKQTLLQLAVMGKLVPQDPNDEPASELLKRIQIEKAKLIAEGKIKKDKTLAAITKDEKPFELPAGWEWSRLGDVTSGMDSGWSPACLENSSPSNDVWGVLKTTSVQVMQYLEYENKELPGNLKPRPDAEVKIGDILFTRAGPMNRVGVSCLVQSTRPRLMISDKIIRFHPMDIGIYGRFIALCLNAGATADYLEKAKSGMAASQVNITQDKLRFAPVPIAPQEEQHRIVAKVDELMAICDQLKSRLTEVSQLQQKLADVLVQQALA